MLTKTIKVLTSFSRFIYTIQVSFTSNRNHAPNMRWVKEKIEWHRKKGGTVHRMSP